MTDHEFTLFDRITKIRSVAEQYGAENMAICYSGGKDSNVMHTLFDEALPGNKIPRVYSNTGLQYLQMVKFVKSKVEQDDRFFIIQPTKNVRKTLEEVGYPFKSKMHSHYVERYRRIGWCPSVQAYADAEYVGWNKQCPKKLRYQFDSPDTPSFPISDKCCIQMKEKPLDDWIVDHGYKMAVIGIRSAEGGRRDQAKCLAKGKQGLTKFNVLLPVNNDWEEWYIRERKIQLPPMYEFGLTRTGCRGCPFAIGLQKELDIMQKYMPLDYKAAELVWKPVYDEYRRIGYRLRSEDGTNN